MELINPEKALSTEMRGAPPRSSEELAPANPRAAQMLTRIWLAAQAVWGHKWTSTQGELPIDERGQLTIAGQLWASGLRGLSERQVLETFDRLTKLGQVWPPNLPELRKYATEIPDFDPVNHELLTSDTQHRSPFARLVWTFIDGYQHRHVRVEEAKRMRRDAYDRAVAHVLQGGELPRQCAGTLGRQEAPAPNIPSTRAARIAKLEALLGDEFHEDAANRTLEEVDASGQTWRCQA